MLLYRTVNPFTFYNFTHHIATACSAYFYFRLADKFDFHKSARIRNTNNISGLNNSTSLLNA
nr:MAG TPA: hypothetical protein [Caudoviricetes sp.]